MPIFTAIGGLIAGALLPAGASLFGISAGALIGGALKLGASLLLSYKNRPKPQTQTAIRGTVRVGAGLDCAILFGEDKVKGHLQYYAKWGAGNRRNAYVKKLADGWCDGLAPYVYIFGELVDLIEQEPVANEAARYTLDGYGSAITIRFYDGRPGQLADSELVAATSDMDTPWRSTSRGTNVCYVVEDQTYDAGAFSKGLPEITYVLRGQREYDPRKDSTVSGGSGSHRLDDRSTWEFSQNNAVHRINYLLGHRGVLSGEVLVGVGKQVDEIDLPMHMLAANICDTERTVAGRTVPTYHCNQWASAGDDHLAILKNIEDAMAGYAVNASGLDGVLAGAPQIPVREIMAADIRSNDDITGKNRRRDHDGFNVLSGQYSSKATGFEPEGLKTVSVNADVELDGGKRLAANDFLQVSDPDIAQYLLNIRYRQNRKAKRRLLPVTREMAFDVQLGEWVTYEGVDWMVVRWGFDKRYRFTLDLAETGSDVYSEEGIEAGPVVIPHLSPSNPSLISTVANFGVTAGLIEGADGAQVPALQFTWDDPEDPTVVAVRIEYRKNGTTTPVFQAVSNDPASGSLITSPQVMSGTTYDARATITTVPDRLKTHTPWVTTSTETGSLKVILAELGADVIDRFDDIETDLDTTAADLAQEVTDRAAAVAAEAVARAAAVAAEAAARADAIAAEASARETAITAEADDRAAQARVQSADIRRNIDDLLDLATEVVDLGAGAELERAAIRREIKTSSDTVTASFVEAITIATGPDSAIVQAQTTLEAAIEDEVSAREASIGSLQTAYTSADEALASEQTALAAAIADEVSDREASIDTVNAAYAAADTVVALQTATLATQIRGSYEGSDYALAGGMIAQLNSSVTSQFESVSTALASISAGVGEQFDFSTIWNFDTTIQGWTGNGTPTWVSGGGWMRPANHATDPYVVSPSGLEVDLDTYPQVRMRIRKTGSPVWEGYLWWKLAGDGSWDAGRRVTMDEPTFEGGIALVSQDLGATGELDQIRIDLSDAQDGTDYFEIDWVAVGRPSPGASVASLDTLNQALSNAINSEASTREALSTKIFGVTDPAGLDLDALSSGLLYEEKTARSFANTAILESFTVLEGTVADVESGLSATGEAVGALGARVSTNEGEITSTSEALTTLEGTVDSVSSGLSATGSAVSALGERVTANEEGIEAVATSIEELGTTVAGKADVSALEDIEAGINISNLEGLTAHSRAIRALETTLLADAMEAAEIGAGSHLADQEAAAATAFVREETYTLTQQNEEDISAVAGRTVVIEAALPDLASANYVSSVESRVAANEEGLESAVETISALTATVGTKASADALTTLSGRVTDTETATTAITEDISSLNSVVAGKASASGLSILTGRVSDTEEGIGAVAGRTDTLESTVNNETTGVAATASALSTTNSTVSDLNGVVTSLAEDVTAVATKADNATAGGLAKWTASAGTGDVSVSFEQLFRASLEGEDIEAGEIAEIYTEGGVLKARKILRYDKVLFAKADGTPVAVFGDDSGDLVIQNIRVGTVKFDQLSSDNGKLVLKGSGSDASIEVFS